MNDLDTLIQILSAHMDSRSTVVTAQTHLDDLGMDSLMSLRFARAVQDRLGIVIELEDLFDCLTVEDLAAHLRSRNS
ncbi:acyl carrier protein [Pelomonas sp. P7]|uniref:Acyl carrier protein n=1 Tax=Pelomonas caseinilytica TaxID=2906763 RepID=A0ABS8XJH1_9BURK|nr:acyl carrier protein [Pelomonas sp. P7]MCE4539410.1 acyl carrier protein [Pelomonas sp. P7]